MGSLWIFFKTIRKMTQEEKRKGNAIRIGNKKLTINGEEWKWNGSKDKLEKVGEKN
ncbi:unnamed protein product [Acanthoscelides obtectus]|uniref:Uncharacterized protein n=1 Tax=Acanthoscelides obtectus TaxID=200917 RepID=A0A9P0JYY7_ACAOB|nr:unnamed protein product [Acanthoscelides obtectus]CAK1633775.1 hypothetical protein AOBTE_LOCUS8382 [Acanthoscelides obtectus]